MTLRRRLTIALALAVGLSAAALAVGSYFVVRQNLLADSVHSSAQQARRNLRIAPLYLKQPAKLLEAYGRGGGFDTVGVQRGLQFSSSLHLGLEQVPLALRRLVRHEQLAYQRRSVAGTHYLIVGGPVGKQTELYYFFSEQSLRHELVVLRSSLLIGGGVLVLLAAFAGAILARRTLPPAARASEAAPSLAQGLLETPLPAQGAGRPRDAAGRHGAGAGLGRPHPLGRGRARDGDRPAPGGTDPPHPDRHRPRARRRHRRCPRRPRERARLRRDRRPRTGDPA